MQDRLISVVIINNNGKIFLDGCLSALLKTEYDNFEVIFIDNKSNDGSAEYVRNNFKDERIKIFETDKNYGVPGGRNIGYQKAKGEFVVFLDNDTEVDPSWLKELIKVFDSDPKIAVAQSKLLKINERNVFDHAGDYMTPLGFLFERSNQGVDAGQFDIVEDILSAKGAATMIRSAVFEELGRYDDSYFMYLEETDFCLRAWLGGYRVVFTPRSVVWHAYGTSLKATKEYYSDYTIRYYGCRNYILTLLKNLSIGSLIKILPLHILSWFSLSLLFLIRGKIKDSFWITKGIFWNLFNLPQALKKRSYVQRKIRKIKDGEFLGKLMIKKSILSYFKKATCYLDDTNYTEN